jgi:hypothetical protein
VENAVLVAQRWILAKLRNHKFFSIGQANEAVWKELEALNDRKFQKLDCSRRELWSTDRRSARCPPRATPLPSGARRRSTSTTTWSWTSTTTASRTPSCTRRWRPGIDAGRVGPDAEVAHVEHPREAHAERILEGEDLVVEPVDGPVDIAGSTDNHRLHVYRGWRKAQDINDYGFLKTPGSSCDKYPHDVLLICKLSILTACVSLATIYAGGEAWQITPSL